MRLPFFFGWSTLKTFLISPNYIPQQNWGPVSCVHLNLQFVAIYLNLSINQMWNDILSLFQLKFPLVQDRNNKHVARENKKIQIPSFTENLLTDIVFTAWSQLDPCNKSISNFIRHASFDTWNRNFWETIYCPLLLNFGSFRKKLVSNKIAKASRRLSAFKKRDNFYSKEMPSGSGQKMGQGEDK